MTQAEFEGICRILDGNAVAYKVVEHEAVRTSAEAAAVRGSSLSQGVKALLVRFTRKQRTFFAIIDVPADRRLDFKKAKAFLQADEVKFASPDEVVAQTGCEPGGVPPFGHANKLAVIVHPGIFVQEELEFNAGLKTKSIVVSGAGLKKAFDAVGVVYADLAEDRKPQ